MDEVLRRARELGRHHREIVLTGIDIGQYGSGLGEDARLEALLELLARDGSVPRLRLSSLDPTSLTDGIVRAIAGGGICRHVHLSLQSASDAVLAAMGRSYTSRDALRTVERLVEAIPGIAVTADIIAGFPGETPVQHDATVDVLSRMSLAGMHVFPYSAMPGTVAAVMPGQVPHAERRRRAAELRGLAQKNRRTFLNGLIGSSMDVIVTSREPAPGGTVEAFSDNAVVVRLKAGVVGYAMMGRARVTGAEGGTVSGDWE
jgi:threonylcarbamoyladenosine tRNA methylthiotransferase MtaB